MIKKKNKNNQTDKKQECKTDQHQVNVYEQETDIHLGTKQEKHLPHKAWQAVQQKNGRVNSTLQNKNKVVVNNDNRLKKEIEKTESKTLKKLKNK